MAHPVLKPRALTSIEAAVLEALLAQDFPGVVELRTQAHEVLAVTGCTCGCGTIDLLPQGANLPRSASPSPTPSEGRVRDADDADQGGILLFLTDGLLASLEVYSYFDPMPMPSLDRVEWVLVPR